MLDHVIALNERHLKRLLSDYISYYHDDRTHLGLNKQTPGRRFVLWDGSPWYRTFAWAVCITATTGLLDRCKLVFSSFPRARVLAQLNLCNSRNLQPALRQTLCGAAEGRTVLKIIPLKIAF